MKLEKLFNSLVLADVIGNMNVEITGIQMDSREVKPGDLFIALKGFTVDGHQYIPQALEQGAVALVVEEDIKAPVPVMKVPDSKRALAVISDVFFEHPTRELKLIGLTGTNGKTTTSHLIRRMLEDAGMATGLIGTMNMQIGEKTYPVKNTTPEVIELQRGFRQMKDAGCSHAVIEASSHALHMGRTRGCRFRTALFTNLTQDHLDYHETMENYRDAKALLFSQLENSYMDQREDQALAILNVDEEASNHFAQVTPAQVITYGIDQPADVMAEEIQYHAGGTRFRLTTFKGSMDVDMKLMGKFSVYNALAATAVALGEGVSLEQICVSLESIQGVDGRLEAVDAGQSFTVIVDYAHTPDSLENVLKTVSEITQGQVWCVVGCGGDRDRTKRPLMAAIGAQYSDHLVITSDNPRTEDPKQIIADMEEGLQGKEKTIIMDRGEAIQFAIKEACPGDLVLIAGKGHETYQEVNGIRYEFDDRKQAREAIRACR
ncbi:UDP-N-acetylmuramoyl-L-alanyl-D-glutamate--2,6-diaminopimelate ligase [Marininema halotolerans]|uniref:UDP-N-acetylmuramoyl-L-alanyl-D-glutamate--2,6-diaminopimelate ligase n=1 Tax=Marininema halotolerans TaxID=1155944 RepID=A0A1I6QBX0_9BACL|nr:UDP-N-acetylmuramoyl-L-alanyl-D-glutamate--2,6-diaminopimelate ligase [Marininema halotolerans]SFS49944.1 UDP-N-acetylmuramoyl-L-alanyl-D-glutamate--2,6-diaminopimelate ligase [Marininema halotolerans]